MACKEAAGKWAIITLHPHLPSRSDQIAKARAWGVIERELSGMDAGAIVLDDVRHVKRTTNWSGKLLERETFIQRAGAAGLYDQTVFFATPLCIGFGPAHARETIEALWGVGMQIYVHSDNAVYRMADDITDLLERVSHEANVAYQRVFRQRKAKAAAKRKVERERYAAKKQEFQP
jgi:hypothetical protein